MTISIQPETPPLRQDASGGFRVGSSRVLVELVIRAFQDGATPEAIAQRYPTATLADIYAVIAYYLRHRQELEAYLAADLPPQSKALEVSEVAVFTEAYVQTEVFSSWTPAPPKEKRPWGA